MNDEFKVKVAIEGEADEKQLEQEGKKAGEIVSKSFPKTKIDLEFNKAELETDLKQVKKDIDSMIKGNAPKELVYKAILEKDLFETELKDINSELEGLGEKLQKSVNIEAIGGALQVGIFQKISNGITSLGKSVLGLGDAAQQAKISFTTMLGDGEQAKNLLKDLSEFASKTPFELSGIRDSAKQLLAMGVSAKDMIPTLKSLGDVSAGLNVPLERLALNYGQVLTQGKLTGKELKDFTTAGVPIIEELAKNLGKSETEIQNMASQGKISAQDMVDAFDSMTSAGGRFADLMEEQSKTFGGLMSNLKDEINLTGEAIGEELIPTASQLVEWLGKVTGGIRERVQENPSLVQGITAFVGTVGLAIAGIGSLAGILTLISAGFGALAAPVLGAVAALGALVAVGVTLNNMYKDTQAKLEYAGESYESLTKKIQENKDAMAELQKQMEDGAISIEEYEKKKEELEEQEDKLKRALDDTYMSLEDVNSELENLSNQEISNEQKLRKLEEIKKKAFETMQSVEQLKLSLASLDGKLTTIQDIANGKTTYNPFKKQFRQQQKMVGVAIGKEVGSWFGLSENWEDYQKGLINEKNALQERLDNYDEYKAKEAEIDEQIADLEVKIQEDKIKKLNNLGGGGSGGSKNELNQKKEELKKKRDLMIKEVQESKTIESDKYQKMLEISERYKNELAKLQGQEVDNVIKNAEKQLKAKEEAYKKEISYQEEVNKVAEKALDSTKKYEESIKNVGKEWDKVKEQALKSIREVNNSLKELDEDYAKNTAERLNEVDKSIREFEQKNGSVERLKNYSVLDLKNWGSDEISGIKISDAIEYIQLLQEQKRLNENTTEEIRNQAKEIDNLTESQKKAIEYEKQRAELIEKRNILEAIANGNMEEAGVRFKDDSKEVVQYFDKEKDEWIDIENFKNQEYARDILDNQTALNQKLIDLKAAHEEELKEYGNQIMEINNKYKDDTKNYKVQLDEKKKAFSAYVDEMNEIASRLSSSAHNAYGGSVLQGNASWVGENGPEQIIARQSSYVQPRNAINNNSTVYNNQSSLNINGLELGNFNSIDDLLAELKNRLTYRN